MDLFEQVSEDIKNAMKAKDKVALETLRNVKKFFLEAKTAPGANDTLMDADAGLFAHTVQGNTETLSMPENRVGRCRTVRESLWLIHSRNYPKVTYCK